MPKNRSWQDYERTYRATQMHQLASWIAAGHSGSVVGLGGAGKSNVLGFLSYRPEILREIYLSANVNIVEVVPVDLNNLPAVNLNTFYRVLLRSFYEIRHRFDEDMQSLIADLYLSNRAERDAFVTQSALRVLFFYFQHHGRQTVLVLDRFDLFCEIATPSMFDSLRGLRDSFKDTLSYIVGMRHEVAYLPEPEKLGEMRELLDQRVCWVAAMEEADARRMIEEETFSASPQPSPVEVEKILALTGGYPALLKAVCSWWVETVRKPPVDQWLQILLLQDNVQYRLEELWEGLTQEEQYLLSEVHRSWTKLAKGQKNGSKGKRHWTTNQQMTLVRLAEKKLCHSEVDHWDVKGELLAGYIAWINSQEKRRGGLGTLRYDPATNDFYQGPTLLELAPLEREILRYLLNNTDKTGRKFSKTEILANAWPNESGYEKTNEDLEQMISRLRKKIEPNPPTFRYIVTYRSRRSHYEEGAYIFYPEGRPQ